MQTDESPGYIRGGAGVVDTRRLFRVLFVSAAVALAALVVVLTIAAAGHNSRVDNLRHRGVPVDVTVTSCLGILSGTGITVTYFNCSGSYVLAGRTYNAVIDGSTVNHARGDVVKAIADPKHPTSVSTPSSLANANASWRAFIGAGLVFLFLLLMIAAGVWWSRRRKSARRTAVAGKPSTSVSAGEPVPTLPASRPAVSAPAVLMLALVLLAAAALWWSRRDSAQRPQDGDALG